MFRIPLLSSMLISMGVCALLMGTPVQAQQYDQSSSQPSEQSSTDADQSPGRVARLAWLAGQVQFAPAGEDDWGSVEVNRPMVIGDRLLTGDDGRAVLELGDASVRIDHDSAFDFLNLDQDNVQIELSQGTLNLAVRQLDEGENFEVDTPTVAFVASTPGVYRIDDDPSGTGSMVTVFRGSGIVYGENGVSRQVAEGTSYRFNDSTLTSVDAHGLPQADDFDRFCEARDTNYQRYAQQEQYVPPDMIGGEDLYRYGEWNAVPEYGNVWYPTQVPVGWAPYRYGHWAWIDPWGWTWVGNEPWGFAPFHYGRWVYVRNRWGWLPGPPHVRPAYAPALVAFVGGSGLSVSIRIGGGGPVGWFPLGPRDVYMPWFHASRNYFTRVNVTNIRNVYVNKTVINNFYTDYRAGRAPRRDRYRYAYRNMPDAVTAVPRNVFTDARPVHPAVLKLNRNQLARAEVALRPSVNPGRASLGLHRSTARPAVLKGREPFARPVVARHAPPPRPVAFAAREKVIAQQHGQPLTPAQLRNLREARPAAEPRSERVKLVPAAASAPRRGETSLRPPQPFRNTVHPIPARNQPVLPTPRRPLPSARFRHPEQPTTLPHVPVIRPAGELPHATPAPRRLPVVKPIERAPSLENHAAQRQRQADIEAQQRIRSQQLQQQRQLQEQAQQRLRAQQSQQQRNIQLQAEQRAREQQLQQQHRVEMQSQQRARDQAMQQQMQRQRAMQMQAQQHAADMQRQQMRERAVQRAPQPSNRHTPAHREPPSREHPPASSGYPIR